LNLASQEHVVRYSVSTAAVFTTASWLQHAHNREKHIYRAAKTIEIDMSSENR
jgi:hypothetical protein